MRHLELHILQSVPVACLNRDDFGSPKSAVFGNVPRARVSSQCWKRAIRELLREEAPERFAGERTRLVIEPLTDRLVQREFNPEDARQAAEKLGDALAKLDNPPTRVKTLFLAMSQQTVDK